MNIHGNFPCNKFCNNLILRATMSAKIIAANCNNKKSFSKYKLTWIRICLQSYIRCMWYLRVRSLRYVPSKPCLSSPNIINGRLFASIIVYRFTIAAMSHVYHIRWATGIRKFCAIPTDFTALQLRTENAPYIFYTTPWFYTTILATTKNAPKSVQKTECCPSD